MLDATNRMTSEQYRAELGITLDPAPLAPGAVSVAREIEQAPASLGEIIIEIMGDPVAKQRARTGKGFGFTPKKTKTYENKVKAAGRRVMAGREPTSALVEVEIDFLIEPSPSWPKWKVEAAMAGYVKPPGRSDVDNFCKAALDGLNGIVWVDDRQVVAIKAWQVCCEQSRAIVTVRERETVSSAAQWTAIKNHKGKT